MSDAAASEYFKAYEEYSKTLRTWLVAYGIGGPVLLLTNERVAQAIAKSGYGRWIAGLFLSGVILQVLLASVNKAAMWICYYSSDLDPDEATVWWCELAQWLSKQFWIDLSVDVGTLSLFAIGTWLAFEVFV